MNKEFNAKSLTASLCSQSYCHTSSVAMSTLFKGYRYAHGEVIFGNLTWKCSIFWVTKLRPKLRNASEDFLKRFYHHHHACPNPWPKQSIQGNLQRAVGFPCLLILKRRTGNIYIYGMLKEQQVPVRSPGEVGVSRNCTVWINQRNLSLDYLRKKMCKAPQILSIRQLTVAVVPWSN